MQKVTELILNGANIRESLWHGEFVDNDIDSIQRELIEIGFEYGNVEDPLMHCRDTGFSGNKIYVLVSSLGEKEGSKDGQIRVEMSINSYPEDTKLTDGFRFCCFIPRKQAQVCKAYLLRLLDKVKESEAYINHIVPVVSSQKDKNIGVGVIVFNGDCILVGTRTDGKGLCGPGGGVHFGEDLEEAAKRETQEEFGIIPTTLDYLGVIKADGHKPSYIFKTSSYDGEVKADNKEMTDPEWVKVSDLKNSDDLLFEPFKKSLELI